MTGIAAHASDNILGEVIATRPPLAVDEKTGRVSLSLPHTTELQTKQVNESFSNLSDDDDDDDDENFPAPTEEELKTLRKVAANMPLVTFALCWVEFAERASYYGAKAVFSNFIQFPLPAGAYLKHKSLYLLSNEL
jgi:hypothetical protein